MKTRTSASVGMMKLGKNIFYALAAVSALVCAAPAFAKHNATVLRISPATDGGKYINVEESNTLKQWKYNFGMYFDYAFEPLEFVTTEGSRQRGIVDDLFEVNAVAGVAFTDWFSMGVDFPLVIAETFFDPAITTEEAPQQIKKGLLGDMRVETKFRILNIERYNFGISIVPYVFIPTGNSTYFVGTGMWSPGALLVLDGNIKDRLFLSLNVGYQNYQYTRYLTDDLNPNAFLDDVFILNLGANVRLSNSWAILGEALSEGVISNLWQNQVQNPAEFMIGMRYTSHNPLGLTFTFTGGGGITNGIGSPNYRILFGVNYRRPKITPPPPTPVEVAVEQKIVIMEKIHFQFDKATIRPVSYPILNDVIGLLLANPQITLVRVEGHTDWIGSDDYNMKLSQRRADAVRDYLVSNGIAPSRLIAVGYGESRPIADNNTAQGRARNRRTEFTVIETGGKGASYPAVPAVGGASLAYKPVSSRAPATGLPPTMSTKYGTPVPSQTQPAPQPYTPPQPRAAAPQPQPQPQPQPPVAAKAPSPAAGAARSFSQMKGVIYFPPKDSTLTPEDETKLRQLVDYIKKDKSVIGVRFEAFAGAQGGELGDNDLAWKRATNVQSYLVSIAQGIGRNVEVSNFGFGELTFGEGDDANKGKVVIWIIKKLEK